MTSEWEFEVEQEGLIVAEGSAPDEETARREAMHYAMMYVQDGPDVRVRIFPTQEPPHA
jgi:hypothetical protein